MGEVSRLRYKVGALLYCSVSTLQKLEKDKEKPIFFFWAAKKLFPYFGDVSWRKPKEDV
jgi:hypothetical protein